MHSVGQRVLMFSTLKIAGKHGLQAVLGFRRHQTFATIRSHQLRLTHLERPAHALVVDCNPAPRLEQFYSCRDDAALVETPIRLRAHPRLGELVERESIDALTQCTKLCYHRSDAVRSGLRRGKDDTHAGVGRQRTLEHLHAFEAVVTITPRLDTARQPIRTRARVKDA